MERGTGRAGEEAGQAVGRAEELNGRGDRYELFSTDETLFVLYASLVENVSLLGHLPKTII